MTSSITRRAAAVVIAFLSVGNNRPVEAAPVTFEFAEPVDLGSNLNRIGSLEWSHVLGTEWNTGIQLGGIIGAPNSTIIPAIPPFLNNPIVADTRTGLRLTGHTSGSTGLEFFASFDASGLEQGAAFQFRPRIVDLPAQVSTGQFFRLETDPGVVSSPAFSENLVDLPSFEAGMNFFFNLGLDTRIEYGLFPFVPYGSVAFQPDPIAVNQELLSFEFDLDPESNNGVGTPPTFVILENTPFEQRLGLVGDDEAIYEKQLSVEMSVEGEPIKRRLDIGSAQLVNPFGTGDSILGPEERNLTIKTETDDSTIRYSYDTALLRLGLDVDGIAAYLGSAALTGAGHSFTRIEEKFADDKIKLTLDLIDVKYGPEFGVRETVEIKPDFQVTLSFDREVAINDGQQITLTNTYTGNWNDLPQIALIDEQPVQVGVSFDQLTGEQSKRSVIYLTDYLEFTLLELEELEFFEAVSLSAPPLFQTRTSLLGSLLGEAELELTNQSLAIAPFDLNASLIGTSSFTLTPTPSTTVYWAGGSNFSTSPGAWRELATHNAPASLQNAMLVIATGNSSAQLESDLQPTTLVDGGQGGLLQINVTGLQIPEGSTFQQGGSRLWTLTRINNDGLYVFDGNSVQFNAAAVLAIRGQGEMRFEGTSMAITAPVLTHGQGHTLTLNGAGGSIIVNQFVNDGHIAMQNSVTTMITAADGISNSGSIVVTEGGDNQVTTPVFANDGLVEVSGASTTLTVRHPEMFQQINVQSTSGAGQFLAQNGATMHFTDTLLLLNSPGGNPQPVRFDSKTGGTIRFDGPIRGFDAGVAELSVDETSTMILNGVEVKRDDARVSLVNKGLVEVMSGGNRFYYNPDIPFEPGEEPRIVGINLDNQGTIRIHRNASLGFKAEIVNYVPGGATFGPGTWEIIGDVPPEPFVNSGENVFIPGVFQAKLEIDVAYIINEDTYLGRIDFGDTTGDGVPDGYSAEAYDTSLAVSEANVLLSGAARFDYFNTIRENRGSFTLRNRNHFDTDGDLLNSGAIRVEAESRLTVFGDFTVDEGTVLVDSTSILDVKSPNTLEVVGGMLEVERGAVPLFVNTPWIVREKWVGVDTEGNDIVREARVSFGSAWFPTIGPNADILVEGKQAVLEPLSGMNRIDGKLTLAGGNELHLAHDLDLNDAGTLRLETAAKLYVDGDLITSGQLVVADDTFLDVAGDFNALSGGSIELDGVVHAPNLLTKFGTVLGGTGRLTGSLTVDGTLLGAIAEPGSEANELLVDGQAALGGDLQLMIDGYIPDLNESFSILDAAGGLAGAFSNIVTGQRLDTMDGIGSFLVHYGMGSAFDPNKIILSAFEPTGDFNGDGGVDAADYVVWQKLDGSQQGYNAWRTNFGRTAGSGAAGSSSAHGVPEPSCFVLLLTVLLTTNYRRRSRLDFARTSCTASV